MSGPRLGDENIKWELCSLEYRFIAVQDGQPNDVCMAALILHDISIVSVFSNRIFPFLFWIFFWSHSRGSFLIWSTGHVGRMLLETCTWHRLMITNERERNAHPNTGFFPLRSLGEKTSIRGVFSLFRARHVQWSNNGRGSTAVAALGT